VLKNLAEDLPSTFFLGEIPLVPKHREPVMLGDLAGDANKEKQRHVKLAFEEDARNVYPREW